MKRIIESNRKSSSCTTLSKLRSNADRENLAKLNRLDRPGNLPEYPFFKAISNLIKPLVYLEFEVNHRKQQSSRNVKKIYSL